MNKREARQIALHMVFELEFKKTDEWNKIIENRLENQMLTSISGEEDMDFYAKNISSSHERYIKACTEGVMEYIEEIDSEISNLSKDWDIKRISKMTLAILRLAIYEIKYEKLPEGAVINEAVDLAKEYDCDDASSFINGILGSLVRK